MITVAFVHVGPDAALARVMVATVRRSIAGRAHCPTHGRNHRAGRGHGRRHPPPLRRLVSHDVPPRVFCGAPAVQRGVPGHGRDGTARSLAALRVGVRRGVDRPRGQRDRSQRCGRQCHIPYNTGVMLSKPSGWKFWREAERCCAEISEEHQRWWGDQHAVKAVADSASLCILDLPCETYTYTPESERKDLSGRFVVHYKGVRKRWMIRRGALR